MILESDLRDIHPKWAGGVPSTMHIQDGLPIPKSVQFNLSALLNGRSSLKNGLVILKMNI